MAWANALLRTDRNPESSIPVESHVDRDGNAIAVAGEGMHLMLDPSRKCEH